MKKAATAKAIVDKKPVKKVEEKATPVAASPKKVPTGTFQKTMTGVVVSTKRAKTVGVTVTRFIMHPLYKKSIKRSKVFAAHNELADVKVGDTVVIGAVKPISKTKHFIVLKKV